MKKTFLIIFLLFLLPSTVFGVEMDQPLSCCELKSDVDMGASGSYGKGDIVGSPDGVCILQGENKAMDATTTEWGLICLLGSIGGVTHWMFIVLMVIAPLMIMLGAYYIVTAGADPDKIKKGKDFIIWAAVGLVIALFSNAIPNIISALV